MQTYITYYKSPLGPIEIVGNQDNILAVNFVEGKPVGDDELPVCVKECRKQLDEYFKGGRRDFYLNLDPAGTDFQKAVWRQLLQIPYGMTTSYGVIADILARPNASRAVGSANGKNPIAIIIPCHRVIGSNGSLTGYGGGLWRKRWLIGFERGEIQPLTDIIA